MLANNIKNDVSSLIEGVYVLGTISGAIIGGANGAQAESQIKTNSVAESLINRVSGAVEGTIVGACIGGPVAVLSVLGAAIEITLTVSQVALPIILVGFLVNAA